MAHLKDIIFLSTTLTCSNQIHLTQAQPSDNFRLVRSVSNMDPLHELLLNSSSSSTIERAIPCDKYAGKKKETKEREKSRKPRIVPQIPLHKESDQSQGFSSLNHNNICFSTSHLSSASHGDDGAASLPSWGRRDAELPVELAEVGIGEGSLLLLEESMAQTRVLGASQGPCARELRCQRG